MADESTLPRRTHLGVSARISGLKFLPLTGVCGNVSGVSGTALARNQAL